MLGPDTYEQIVRVVERFIFADMVDFFPGLQDSALLSLYYKPVLIVPSTERLGVLGDLDQNVAVPGFFSIAS